MKSEATAVFFLTEVDFYGPVLAFDQPAAGIGEIRGGYDADDVDNPGAFTDGQWSEIARDVRYLFASEGRS